jgi:hypothetical protein
MRSEGHRPTLCLNQISIAQRYLRIVKFLLKGKNEVREQFYCIIFYIVLQGKLFPNL